MRKLYQFHWNCGRAGDVDGLFMADDILVNNAIGCRVYFGEILGKHSEVSGSLEDRDLIVKSEDQDFIDKLHEVFGRNTIQGYNPLLYATKDSQELFPYGSTEYKELQ